MFQGIEEHLDSAQVSRVIYGAIIGMALIVSLEKHPPSAAIVVGTLFATGLAVGLAELYAEVIGAQTRLHRRVGREHVGEIAEDVVAVFFGVVFPAIFFILSSAGVVKVETAFTLAKWTGLGLIAFYGFAAGRLAGETMTRATLQALAVTAIGGALIAFKAIVH